MSISTLMSMLMSKCLGDLLLVLLKTNIVVVEDKYNSCVVKNLCPC